MHSRFPSHLTAAVSALALILITAGISMVMFMMIARPTPPLRLAFLYSAGGSLAQAVVMVITLAYCAGMLAWILLFALHRAGVQRLSNLQTVIKR
jgi:hypothetical protein